MGEGETGEKTGKKNERKGEEKREKVTAERRKAIVTKLERG